MTDPIEPEHPPLDPDKMSIFRVLEVDGGYLVVPGTMRAPSFGNMDVPETGYFIPATPGSGTAISVPLPPDWEEGL